jgi:hypothetical protein
MRAVTRYFRRDSITDFRREPYVSPAGGRAVGLTTKTWRGKKINKKKKREKYEQPSVLLPTWYTPENKNKK